MDISNYFEKADPEDKSGTSPVIYRAIQFETRLSPVSILEIAKEIDQEFTNKIMIIGVTNDRVTRFRISLEHAGTPSFAKILYQWMNWQNNDSKCNKW